MIEEISRSTDGQDRKEQSRVIYLDQESKTKKTQHLDFTINENIFVKRINTIFISRLANK
jgi:hypothetical protein